MVLPAPYRILLLTLLVVGALLFWADPGALPPWRALGVGLGWAGTGLLLLSLLLMVREPRLARALGGLETVFRWHHLLGVWAYVLLLAHPLALAADGWEESPSVAWATLVPWQQDGPVQMGWVSLLGMMAGLALALSPGLRYASWRALHHLLTLAVVAAAVHLVGLGLDSVLLAVPWLLAVFLAWRLLRADLGLGARPYVVRSVQHLSPSTVELQLQPLAPPPSGAPYAQAGQFVLAAFPSLGRKAGCGEFHPFTLSAIGPDGGLALGIKALGDCTRQLQSIEPGAEVRLQGPFGHFLEDIDGPVLWVAGGIGITPFVAALRGAVRARAVTLLYLHREGPDAPYAKELQELAARQPELRLQIVDTGPSVPDLGPLLPPAEALHGHHCHVCGPTALVDAVRRLLEARGVSAPRIHTERFDFR